MHGVPMLKQLRGRAGFHGIRINARYRIGFQWSGNGTGGVEIVDWNAIDHALLAEA